LYGLLPDLAQTKNLPRSMRIQLVNFSLFYLEIICRKQPLKN
jgi:hypothetical protein